MVQGNIEDERVRSIYGFVESLLHLTLSLLDTLSLVISWVSPTSHWMKKTKVRSATPSYFGTPFSPLFPYIFHPWLSLPYLSHHNSLWHSWAAFYRPPLTFTRPSDPWDVAEQRMRRDSRLNSSSLVPQLSAPIFLYSSIEWFALGSHFLRLRLGFHGTTFLKNRAGVAEIF